MVESRLLDRFKGPDGRRRLINVLAKQELVQNDMALAERLASLVKLKEYKQNDIVYSAGQPANNKLYFILSGKFDLLVGSTSVNVLSAGQHVGEFPIIDPSLSYTVTVQALEPSIIASILAKQFESLEMDYPVIWKNMSKSFVPRLLFRYPSNKDKNVSIVHGHDEAKLRELKELIKESDLNPIILQEQGDLGKTIIEKFEYYAPQANFAIVLMTPDDPSPKVGSVEQKWRARQNVLMELGWFMAKLGRSRVMLLVKGEIELNSDIYGVVYVPFRKNISECADKIRQTLSKAGLIKSSK